MRQLTEIRPRLFISDASIGTSHTLRQHQFDVVLCLDRSYAVTPHPSRIRLELCHIPTSTPNFLEFDEAVKKLKLLMSVGLKVLVHCQYGVSRSVAVVAAYLIESEGMSPADALEEVANKREGLKSVDRCFPLQVLHRRPST